MYVKSSTEVCSALSLHVAGPVANISMKVQLTFLISVFGCFQLSFFTTPWVRFLGLLLATVWALIKQMTKVGPCSFLHVFSGLAVPVLCIPNALVTGVAAHLHLLHDHLSETSRCLEPGQTDWSSMTNGQFSSPLSLHLEKFWMGK